jgi:hypothetical protein
VFWVRLELGIVLSSVEIKNHGFHSFYLLPSRSNQILFHNNSESILPINEQTRVECINTFPEIPILQLTTTHRANLYFLFFHPDKLLKQRVGSPVLALYNPPAKRLVITRSSSLSCCASWRFLVLIYTKVFLFLDTTR